MLNILVKIKCNQYNMVQTNMCVAEVVNEHGYKCTYYFKENCKDPIIATSSSYSKARLTSLRLGTMEIAHNRFSLFQGKHDALSIA